MQFFFTDLNTDQLAGLASLCFDLAKISFAFVLFPTVENNSLIMQVLKVLTSASTGIAFTYGALLLLKTKEKIEK